MTGIFKANNPSNNLLLVLYALVLKGGVFTHTFPDLRIAEGSFLYRQVVYYFDGISVALPWWYGFMVILLQILQAWHLNSVANRLRLFTKPTYLVGMSYLLFTSLIPQWMLFSPHLVAASLIIWCFAKLPILYNTGVSKAVIFNIGMATGICYLLDAPALLFIALVFMGLSIFRSFHLNEWVLLLLGVLTPLYFFFAFLYLGNIPLTQLPRLHFTLPAYDFKILRYTIIGLLILHVFFGLYFVNDNLGKQVVQIRNTWKLAVFYLLVTLIIFFLGTQNKYIYPIFFAAPLALFSAAFYYYPVKRWMVSFVHLVMFSLAIYIAYFM